MTVFSVRSAFRVLLFAVAVIVLGFYLVRDAAISRIIYMVFGIGLMGFYMSSGSGGSTGCPCTTRSGQVKRDKNKLD